MGRHGRPTLDERLQHRLYWAGIVTPTIITILLGIALWGFLRERQLPPPDGRFPVGRATFDWSDFGGPQVVTWYPAEKPPHDSVADYLPGLFAEQMQRGRGPFSQRLGVVTDRAYPGATLLAVRPPLPLVLLSPDWDEQPTDYAVLAEQLASRGYVVVGFSVPDSAGPAQPAARIAFREAALRAFLERMQRLSQANVGLWARLGAERVALVGHGLGGSAALAACAPDPRCALAIDLAGAPPAGVATVKPVLFVEGRGPELPVAATAFPKALGVRVRGLPYAHFGDDAIFFDPLGGVRRLFGRIDGRRGLQVVGAFSAAFLDEHLRATAVPWLHAPGARWPEVTILFDRDR